MSKLKFISFRTELMNGKVYYIDVLKSLADAWKDRMEMAREEYQIPHVALENFKRELYLEKDSNEKQKGLESKTYIFVLLIIGLLF